MVEVLFGPPESTRRTLKGNKDMLLDPDLGSPAMDHFTDKEG